MYLLIMSTELLNQLCEKLNNTGLDLDVVDPNQYDSEKKIMFKIPAGEKNIHAYSTRKKLMKKLLIVKLENTIS